MLGWAIGFCIAALAAALFGFGGIDTEFSGVAIILFWLFVGLLAVSLFMGLFVRGRSEPARARGTGGGTLGLVAFVATIAIVAYAWVENDWTAQEVGRSIDESAAGISADANGAFENAGARAGDMLQGASDAVREDTAQALNDAENTVDPDNDNR